MKDPTLTWKEKYQVLARMRFLAFKATILLDTPRALGFCFRATPGMIVIYIDPSLSWKNKLIVLAHEFGHMATYSPDGGLIEYPRNRSEEDANATGEAICRDFGISSREYWKFVKTAPRDFREKHDLNPRLRRVV